MFQIYTITWWIFNSLNLCTTTILLLFFLVYDIRISAGEKVDLRVTSYNSGLLRFHKIRKTIVWMDIYYTLQRCLMHHIFTCLTKIAITKIYPSNRFRNFVKSRKPLSIVFMYIMYTRCVMETRSYHSRKIA